MSNKGILKSSSIISSLVIDTNKATLLCNCINEILALPDLADIMDGGVLQQGITQPVEPITPQELIDSLLIYLALAQYHLAPMPNPIPKSNPVKKTPTQGTQSTLNKQISTLKGARTKEVNKLLDSNIENLTNARKEVSLLQEQLAQNTLEIDSLKNVINDKDKEVVTLRKKAQKRIKDLKNTINDKDNRITDLMATIDTLNSRIQELELENAQLKALILEKDAVLDALENGKVRELTERIQALQGKLEAKPKETIKEIIKEVIVTKEVMPTKAKSYGIEEIEQIASLIKQGLSFTRMQEVTGLTRGTIGNIKKEAIRLGYL